MRDSAPRRALCAEILETSPDYTDVRTFMGRLYAWDGEYDKARATLQEQFALVVHAGEGVGELIHDDELDHIHLLAPD